MGMGMLFAGALTGGANAMGEIADDQIKSNANEKSRQQQIAERREALLYEMQLKADFARKEEEATAASFTKLASRGEEIGNERGARELEAARATVPNEGEFANERVTPGMLSSMPPAARSIYEKEMGLTDDSTLQGLRDQVQASGEVAAPATVRKAVADSYREEYKADKDRKDRDYRYEQEDRRDARNEANNTARDERAQRSLDASLARSSVKGGPAGQIDQTEKLTVLKDVKAKADATKPKRSDYGSEKLFEKAVGKWQESDDGKMSTEASRRIMDVFGTKAEGAAPERQAAGPATGVRAGDDIAANERSIALLKQQALNKGETQASRDEQIRMIESENAKLRTAEKPAAPKSSVKDNLATSTEKPAAINSRAALDQARLALKKRPDMRDEIMRRLKENGIDPKGL